MVAYFGVVVHKADHAEAHEHEQGEPDVHVGEIGPQKRGEDDPGHDEQSAHGGGSGLGLMLGHVGENGLSHLEGRELFQKPRARDDGEQQREDERPGGTERDVAEHVQQGDVLTEGHKKVIEHGISLP